MLACFGRPFIMRDTVFVHIKKLLIFASILLVVLRLKGSFILQLITYFCLLRTVIGT